MDNDASSKSSDNARTPPGQPREVKPADYLRIVKTHLRQGRQKEAFSLLQRAAVTFPDEPLILSYYGCMQAVVDKKYRSGVETCKKAISLLRKQEIFGEEVLYPVFYLNLGRAYLAANKKKEALDAFTLGMKYDSSNSELMKELRGLGVRRKPPVPFLGRSNPINILIGMLVHKKAKKEPDRRRS